MTSGACWLATLLSVAFVAQVMCVESSPTYNCVLGQWTRVEGTSSSSQPYYFESTASIVSITLGADQPPKHYSTIGNSTGGENFFFINTTMALAIACPSHYHPVGPSSAAAAGSGYSGTSSSGGSSSSPTVFTAQVYDIATQQVLKEINLGEIPDFTSALMSMGSDKNGNVYWVLQQAYGLCWTLNTMVDNLSGWGEIQGQYKNCNKNTGADKQTVILFSGGPGITYTWRSQRTHGIYLISRSTPAEKYHVYANGSVSGWGGILDGYNAAYGHIIDADTGIASVIGFGSTNFTLYTTSNIYTNGSISLTAVAEAVELPRAFGIQKAYCDGSSWFVIARGRQNNDMWFYNIQLDGTVTSYPMYAPMPGAGWSAIACA